MAELRRILALWRSASEAGESCVLATVVKTQGSSYRLPGARLLLTSLGERAGSISGGCLEDDLLKKAWWLTENGPVIRRYDTTPDGEIATEFGLGCNGIVHVLLERVFPNCHTILDDLHTVESTRKPLTVAHIISPAAQVGSRVVVDPAQDSRGDGSGESEQFLEYLVPPIHLLLCGAGEDAIPVSRLAHFLGWKVSVFDGRSHYARADKFRDAAEVVVVEPDSIPTFPGDPWTVALLMSHSYSQDLAFLTALAGLRLPYVGILGPRKRSAQLLVDAGLQAQELAPALHAPMGLDIGADGPEQVALAVIAEITAVFAGRDGGELRWRQGSIHASQDSAVCSPSPMCVL